MASKKTNDKTAKAPAKKAAAKKPAKAKAETKKATKSASPAVTVPRHPKGRLAALHGSKEALAKSLAESLAREDEDTDVIANRLNKASNSQLLRLSQVVATVKEKFGSRDKLIAAIGSVERKATDKDYLAKLDTFSLPHLLELATSQQRRARAE
jgi:hypothetical protein